MFFYLNCCFDYNKLTDQGIDALDNYVRGITCKGLENSYLQRSSLTSILPGEPSLLEVENRDRSSSHQPQSGNVFDEFDPLNKVTLILPFCLRESILDVKTMFLALLSTVFGIVLRAANQILHNYILRSSHLKTTSFHQSCQHSRTSTSTQTHTTPTPTETTTSRQIMEDSAKLCPLKMASAKIPIYSLTIDPILFQKYQSTIRIPAITITHFIRIQRYQTLIHLVINNQMRSRMILHFLLVPGTHCPDVFCQSFKYLSCFLKLG